MSDLRTAAVWEDSNLYLMGRIMGVANVAIVQADLSAASLVITKAGDDPGTAVTLTVPDVVFNTLQTDARWSPRIDTTGYNFRHLVTPAMIPSAGDYIFEYKLTFTGGEIAHVVYEVPVKNLLRS